MSKKVTRLFDQFQPQHYELTIAPDREKLTFSGSVKITGKKAGRPSQRLTLHQKGLKIISTQLFKDGNPIEISRINKQDSFDELRIHTKDKLFPGKYEVVVEFAGKITNPMSGIYPCYFKYEGKDKRLIATQFESHHAREAFVCIDEPEAKATFDLTLQTAEDKNDVVLANTPTKQSSVNNGIRTTVFETTPKMSTYLLAFAYGEMKSKEATTHDGVKVRTFATPDNIDFTEFALETAVKALEFYNDYFDIAYPLEKCDFVALPDFAAGAMENWGLITFREQALLVDPKNTSLHLKQYVANVVSHELTHQWFGNLVTMRWWTDLWLNESFASWMSWLAVDHIYPDWKVWTQFIVDEQSMAMKLDALEHTHPIEVEVNHPDEIRTIFDAISYEKGASVLLMLHQYLGPDNFRDGLRLYLKRHAYANTNTIDLWTALEEVSKMPVKKFMGVWTSQSGYPIVNCSIEGNKLKLTQERFYLNPSANKQKSIWPIPLQATNDIGINTLEIESEELAIPAKPTILNHNQTSFYRAVYGPKLLEAIGSQIDAGEVNELDRLGLLSDAIEAAKAGYVPTTSSLELLKHFRNENSTVVWDIIGGAIGSLRVVMGDEIRDVLKPYVKDLTLKQVQRLGWEEGKDEDHFDILLRPTILGLASWADNRDVVAEATRQFQEMTSPEDIKPNVRGVVYGTVARNGSVSDFKKMIDIHDNSSNSEERVTLAASICGFKQPELIDQALAKITSEDVRLQDAAYWIAYSFMNRFARDQTWEWLKQNWNWLEKNLGGDLSFFRMPLYAGRNYSDESFINEFSSFFQKHMSPAFERPVSQAIETIQWQSAWKKRDQAEIAKYLKTSKTV